MRLGHCEHLRESALVRFLPKRLMVTEGLIQLDDDRAVWRRPAVNVYREVVEFRERRRIVGAIFDCPTFSSMMKSAPEISRKVLAAASAPPGSDEWADAWKTASPIAIE